MGTAIVANCVPAPTALGEFLLGDSRFPAIYFLFNRSEVVYVGQSNRLSRRIDQHIQDGVKTFDAVAYIPCKVNQLASLEAKFIRDLAPKYNACGLSNKVRERNSWRAARNRDLAHRHAPKPGEPIQTIDASECIIPDAEIGEFLMIGDRDAKDWSPLIADKSVAGLIKFAAQMHPNLSEAQKRYDDLV